MIDYLLELMQIIIWTISVFFWALVAGMGCALFIFPILAVTKLFL